MDIKNHNPTPEQLEAVARMDTERRISCEKILERYRKEQEEKRNKLLITKTKKK